MRLADAPLWTQLRGIPIKNGKARRKRTGLCNARQKRGSRGRPPPCGARGVPAQTLPFGRGVGEFNSPVIRKESLDRCIIGQYTICNRYRNRFRNRFLIYPVANPHIGEASMVGKHTINDIARLAGVSKATVSRVLNHKPDVDPATRERILRIMEEQGFVPSITASGLASGRSRLIGV